MTILVTGAGLIGTNTARLLLDQGEGVCLYDPNPSASYIERVVGPDRKLLSVERGDTRDFANIVEVMRRRGVTRILHTGGVLSTRVDENPYQAFQSNVLGTLNAIEAARLHGLARVVFISSAQAILMDPASEGAPFAIPDSLYGTYNAMTELLGLAYQRLDGVNVLILRPPGVYGYGEFSGGARWGTALQDLLVQALREPGATLHVTIPAAERVYAKDFAQAAKEAIFAEHLQTRVYNIDSGEIVDAHKLADTINAAIPNVRAVAAQTEGGRESLLDITHARQDLKYDPQWPLARAIPDYIADLRSRI